MKKKDIDGLITYAYKNKDIVIKIIGEHTNCEILFNMLIDNINEELKNEMRKMRKENKEK